MISSQTETANLPNIHILEALHCCYSHIPITADWARKLQIPVFLVLGLTEPRIKPKTTVSFADGTLSSWSPTVTVVCSMNYRQYIRNQEASLLEEASLVSAEQEDQLLRISLMLHKPLIYFAF